MASVLAPSKVVASPVYQLSDSALKSLVTTIKNGLLAEIVSLISSKLFHKFSKSSLDSFGDHLNNETKLHVLSPSFLRKVAHLFNPFITEAVGFYMITTSVMKGLKVH